MTWSPGELEALDTVAIGSAEIVYAFVSLDGAPSATELELLDAGERDRARRFVREEDRRRFTLAHAALRRILGLCIDVPPADVRFETGDRGKPRLSSELEPLEFNMAHSHELALVAVARHAPVGVDLEWLGEIPAAIELADSHFSKRERRILGAVPKRQRSELFLRYWTRKEAVIKASGEGLSRTLNDFDVDTAPRVVFAPGASGSPARWALDDLPAPNGYLAAVAVAATSRTPHWRPL